jgi:hypothetical protein
MDKMAPAKFDHVNLIRYISQTTQDPFLAFYVGSLANPETDPQVRGTDFINAADHMQEMVGSGESRIELSSAEKEIARRVRQGELLEYLDTAGAGLEAHVAAAFAGYYTTIPPEAVHIIE